MRIDLEAWREHEAAWQARRAAARTRDGVVDLEEFRVTTKAARGLRAFLTSDWVLRVRVVQGVPAGLELEVVLLSDDWDVRLRIPTRYDGIPVRVAPRNPAAAAPPS